MIGILGIRRIAILAALVAVNAIMALIVYGYLIPATAAKEKKVGGLRGEVATLQNSVNTLQVELDQLGGQLDSFRQLEEKGFFDEQNRRDAEILLQQAQEDSGIVSARADILPGEVETNSELDAVGYQVLKSIVEIKIASLTDYEIIKYVDAVRETLPGHVTVDLLELHRGGEVDVDVLRAVSGRVDKALAYANVELVWRTLIPKVEDLEAN